MLNSSSVAPPAEAVTGALGERAYLFRRAVLLTPEGLLMTPRRTDTDGFFVSLLRRS
jgi:16S rRNA (cytosine967-C5)-methyltransferase